MRISCTKDGSAVGEGLVPSRARNCFNLQKYTAQSQNAAITPYIVLK
jgi:hypothetical protein